MRESVLCNRGRETNQNISIYERKVEGSESRVIEERNQNQRLGANYRDFVAAKFLPNWE